VIYPEDIFLLLACLLDEHTRSYNIQAEHCLCMVPRFCSPPVRNILRARIHILSYTQCSRSPWSKNIADLEQALPC
jgi:hypothetical protein